MRRSRATPTEERELLPLHRPSTSLSLSIGSRPTVLSTPLSPNATLSHPPPPPPRRRSSTTTTAPQPPTSSSLYKRRETAHDAALARLTGTSGNPPHAESPTSRYPGGGGAPVQIKSASTAYGYVDNGPSNLAGEASANASVNANANSYNRRQARHLSLPPPHRSSSSAPHPSVNAAIYDPYTGQYRGTLVSPRTTNSMIRARTSTHHHHHHADSPPTSSSASSIKTTSSSSPSSSDKEDDVAPLGPPPDVQLLLSAEEQQREREMWATLARIRTIQSEVSKKQLSLEAFGKDGGVASGEEYPAGKTVSPRGSLSRKSGRETLAGGTTSDEYAASTKNERKRTSLKTSTTANSPTANTAAQQQAKDPFAQRREAIDEIVKKLDDLSSAVKQLNTHKPTTPPSTSPQPSPTFTSTSASHASPPPPTLQIPATTTRPAGGFGWRSPSTSRYTEFVEQFLQARNPTSTITTSSRIHHPPSMNRASTTPAALSPPTTASSNSRLLDRRQTRGVVYESSAEF